MTAEEVRSFEWVDSTFAKALQAGNCVICLDELTRCEPTASNAESESSADVLTLGVELERVSDTGRSISFVLAQNSDTGIYSLEVEYEEDGTGVILGGFTIDRNVFDSLKEGKLLNENL